ncbi:MAG: EAL domain-containing protein [Pseudomonadota bacterium]
MTDSLRSQLIVRYRLTGKTIIKRFAFFQLLLVGCWYAGFSAAAVTFFVWVALAEVAFLYLGRTSPVAHKIQKPRLVASFVCIFVAALGYYLPAGILTTSGDLAFVLLGFMWILAAMSVNLNQYIAMPAFFWASSIPAFVVGLGAMALGFGDNTATSAFWTFPALLMLLQVINMILMLRDASDIHKELAETRAETLQKLRELEYRDRHDILTGLSNRRAFSDTGSRVTKRASPDRPVSIYSIDLDGFKPVNDTFGHDAGDHVLCEIAKRLQSFEDSSTYAFRMGGDEFLVLTENRDSRAVETLSSELIECCRAPIDWNGRSLTVSASVGIATTYGPIAAEALCTNADRAMFMAKASAEEKSVLFEADAVPKRQAFKDKDALATAISTREIVPFFQPKIALNTEQTIGYEASPRWCRSDGRVLQPSDFMNDVEDLNLTSEMMFSILEQTLEAINCWLASGLDPGAVSMALPEIVLATDTGQRELDRLLAKHLDARKHLTFEITENVFFDRSNHTIKDAIRYLREQGIRMALDDYGTGYASLRHLQELEIDEVKLDATVVAGIGSDVSNDLLVESFLHMANGLAINLIADGVETDEQATALKRIGVRWAQGVLWSEAVAFDKALLMSTDAVELQRQRAG